MKIEEFLKNKGGTIYRYAPLLLLLLIISCSDNGGSSDENQGLSGKFAISGQGDHSSIVVKVFNSTNIVEDALLGIKNRFPETGPELTPQALFNHQIFSAINSTSTDVNGNWRFPGINNNVPHIVVAEHPDIGFAYFFDVQGNNEFSRVLNLKAVLDTSQFAQNLVFNDQVVDITGQVFVDNLSSITIVGDCFFNFTGTVNSLKTRADFICQPGSRLTILNSGFGSATLEFENVINIDLQNVSVLEPVRIVMDNSRFQIQESLFLGADNTALLPVGLNVFRGSGKLNNVIFMDQEIALSVNGLDSLNCVRSIFSGNKRDLEISGNSFTHLADNFFATANRNMRISASTVRVEYNHFESTTENILVTNNAIVNVNNNIFEDCGTNIWLQNWFNEQFSIQLDATFNNFMMPQAYAIQLDENVTNDSVNAVNNYWGTTVEQNIQEIILDKTDFPNASDSLQYIKFKPFENQPVANAGIR